MKRITFARLAVLMLAVAGLVLQGCGGDDGGVSQASYDQVVMERDEAVAAAAAANAARDAAMEAQTQAETAQMAAEAAQAEAEAAQGRAEAARDEAQMQRDAAHQAQGRAETAEMVAKEAEAAAKMAQMEAETAQQAAEDMLASVEADRDMYKEAARMAAMEAQTMAEAARDAANMAKDEAEAAAAAAKQAQMDAEAERDAANTARDNYKMMVEQAQQAEADALNALAEARRQLAIAQGMVDAESAADIAARAKMLADAMQALIADDAVEADTTATPPVEAVAIGDVMLPDDAPSSLALTHTAAAGVKAVPIVASDRRKNFRAYTEGDTMPPAIAGWDGLTLERRDEPRSASQALYVYTDIAAAGDVSFLEKYKAATATIGGDTSGRISLASSASFPGRTDGSLTYTARGTADDPPTGYTPFAGMFDGVSGTFSCTGADNCVVTADAGNGSLSLTAGTLTFTPDDITDLVTSGDGEYLYFGYWLHKPDDPRGMHRFSTFAGGMDMFTLGATATPDAGDDTSTGASLLALNGTARFQGPAAGKYVTRNLVANTAEIGQFTADAELLADFGTTTTSGVITGSVTNFMENGESLGNWSVTLQSMTADGMPANNLTGLTDSDTDTTADGVQARTSFMGSTMATVGGANAYGRWSGMFYGDERKDGRPDAAAGMFDAIAEHAAISGAFGVYNTKGE